MTYLGVVAAAVILGGETCGSPAPTETGVASVSVQPSSVTIARGGTATLVASPKDAGGKTVNGVAVIWSSANNAIATVSQSGVVTGVTVGSTTITAASGGKTGSATVNVVSTLTGATIVTKTPVRHVSRTFWLGATLKDLSDTSLINRSAVGNKTEERLSSH